MRLVTVAATPAANSIPPVDPRFATLPITPRRLLGAASVRYVTESTNSPPTENPCTIRTTIRRIGAQTPTD